MEIKTNILHKMAEKIGRELRRAAAVADQIESPWDLPEVPNTISADERAMLCQARDGVSWPADTAEAMTCEWLAEHGLLRATGTGDDRVWKPTKAGKKLAEHIHGRDEELRHDCKLDRFAALKNDAAAEALVRGGMPK